MLVLSSADSIADVLFRVACYVAGRDSGGHLHVCGPNCVAANNSSKSVCSPSCVIKISRDWYRLFRKKREAVGELRLSVLCIVFQLAAGMMVRQ